VGEHGPRGVANMLQFKINPAELLKESVEERKLGIATKISYMVSSGAWGIIRFNYN